ncbi:hypothetical protein HK096_003187, partial [Nowakowskiella sp. JEL0078]
MFFSWPSSRLHFFSLVVLVSYSLFSYYYTSTSYQSSNDTSDPFANIYLNSTSNITSEHSSILLYIPGPCLPSNDEFATRSLDVDFVDNSVISTYRKEWQSFLEVDYPEIFSSFDNWTTNGFERGIAFAIHEESDVDFLITSIFFLRNSGCHLPIEVWSFQDFNSRIETRILELSLDDSPVVRKFVKNQNNSDSEFPFRFKLDGDLREVFLLKVITLLNTEFEQILLLDPDVMVLKNPTQLFETEEYLQTGGLFWPDLTKTTVFSPYWRWMGQSCVDEWDQDGSFVLINRRKSWKAIALLWFVNRNEKIRNWHSSFSQGSKDMFRFAWRSANIPMYFIQHYLAPAGFYILDEPKKKTFCGTSKIQHDIGGSVLFANIKLLRKFNKRRFNSTYGPLSVIKNVIPIEDFEPGPVLGSQLAWTQSRGVKFFFMDKSKDECLNIQVVDRQTQIMMMTDFNEEFEKHLFGLLIKFLVKVDEDEYKREQEQLEKDKSEKEQLERQRFLIEANAKKKQDEMKMKENEELKAKLEKEADKHNSDFK